MNVKEAVLECFFPKRGFKLRLKDARKVISDFKKLEPDPESLADVMLYYVECGVRFTNDFGDIDEPFYTIVLQGCLSIPQNLYKTTD